MAVISCIFLGSITNLLITSYPSQLSSELFSPVAGLKQLERHLHGNNDIDGTVEVTIPDTQSQVLAVFSRQPIPLFASLKN